MLAAVATFAVMDLSMKRLVETYPAIQVTFLRGVTSLPLLLAATGLLGRWGDLVPRRWTLHLVRGLLSVFVLWAFVYAVKLLSLGDAYAIFMSAPLVITALSVPMLGERVGWRRWLAVCVGLIGVLVILKPSGNNWISLGGLAALAASIGYAINALTIRILSRSDTADATIVWPLVILAAASGFIALPAWVPLRLEHAAWIATLGITGALAQHLMTYAFRRATPAVLAPLEYTALAWAMLFDYVVWATTPSLRMLAGAAIIVASGLYVFQRERRVAARHSATVGLQDPNAGKDFSQRRRVAEVGRTESNGEDNRTLGS
ncbi:MAG: DMT family transporter [Xanthomonadaceae bacterium]|nr:DMT family transporter [Xanthomonadaceae bacterium]